MFITIFLVACVAAAFEIGLASKWRWYRIAAGNNLLVNLGGSMAISYVLSAAWDVTGLIAMVSALLSTLMTIPYYKVAAFWDTVGRKRLDEARLRLMYFRERWETNWKELISKSIRTTEVLLRVFTFPLNVYRKASSIIHRPGRVTT